MAEDRAGAGPPATLQTTFDWDPDAGRLHVAYRVASRATGPMLILDRGDTHAVMLKRLRAGEVPQPTLREEGGGLVMTHAGRPLPDPSPTLPPIPLGARVAAGATHTGSFDLRLRAADAPRRVRYCLGVVVLETPPSADAAFDGVWRATPDQVASQQMLCSDWFTLAGVGSG